jgi:hypothetical protein
VPDVEQALVRGLGRDPQRRPAGDPRGQQAHAPGDPDQAAHRLTHRQRRRVGELEHGGHVLPGAGERHERVVGAELERGRAGRRHVVQDRDDPAAVAVTGPGVGVDEQGGAARAEHGGPRPLDRTGDGRLVRAAPGHRAPPGALVR